MRTNTGIHSVRRSLTGVVLYETARSVQLGYLSETFGAVQYKREGFLSSDSQFSLGHGSRTSMCASTRSKRYVEVQGPGWISGGT